MVDRFKTQIFRYHSKHLPLPDLVRWTHMFYALFAAGLPIIICLQTLQQSEHFHTRRFLPLTIRIVKAVENGERLSNAMKMTEFPMMFVRMIEIAEETGEFEQCLRLLSNHFQQQMVWKRQLRKLATYPLFVFLVTASVMLFASLYILPEFQSMYQMMGIQINAFTMTLFILLRFSLPLITILLLISAFSTFFVYRHLAKDPERLLQFFSKLCNQPIIGMYAKIWFSKLFTEVFSPLLQAGLPVLISVQILFESTHHPLLRVVAHSVYQTIMQGYPLSIAIHEFPFSNELQAMIQLAEHTGDLAGSLARANQLLQQEWQDAVSLFIERTQPVLMIGVGSLVGSTVLLVMLPLFQLMNAL